jgi:hypothetical protein
MRDANARRLFPFRVKAVAIAGPLAFLATASAVTLGVLAGGPQAPDSISAQHSPSGDVASKGAAPLPPRSDVVSRGAPRVVQKPSKLELVLSKGQTQKALAKADRKLWTETVLNIWTQPGEKAKNLGELDAGLKVLITGRSLYGRDEVVIDGKSRWVTRGYLTDEKPFTLGGACTNGTTVDSGVSPNIVAVHDAVCAEFPEISVYGALRGGGGDHATGHAVDIMVSGDLGYQVAEFVRKYYSELGVSYVIYSQHIWSVERSGEGWRSMSDRGSTTANHYDHVHVSVY